MAFTFTLEHPMSPIWIRFPNISPYSIGWRMGYGEDYKWQWSDWLETLPPAEQLQYQVPFPHPIFWREYYNAEYDYEDILDYECEHVQLWSKQGEMKYSLATLRQPQDTTSFLFFWRPQPSKRSVDSSNTKTKYKLGEIKAKNQITTPSTHNLLVILYVQRCAPSRI